MFQIRKTSGFTMIEMIIAVTIFAFMSITITSVYIQTTYMGQKMRHTRHLSETAREITERIADDVREKGINVGESQFDDHIVGSPWRVNDYTHSGTEILGIGTGSEMFQYIFGTVDAGRVRYCKEEEKTNQKKHCGLYKVSGHKFSEYFNVVDSFIPEEERKRVKIENMKFYISGDGIWTEKKVTLVFTLTLMPRIGIPASLITETRLHVQTTVSERFFKENN